MQGTMFCMPFVVFNLGGEMLYILQQRLKAQNIGESKGKKGTLIENSLIFVQ